MEINKNLLVCSIGTAIVVVAGGVYANIRAIKKIKYCQESIFDLLDLQSDMNKLMNKLQNAANECMEDQIIKLSKEVDSLKKSNKK